MEGHNSGGIQVFYSIMGKRFITIVLFVMISRIFILHNTMDFIQLDVDECVMGVMAQHLIEGTSIPTFFYGQQYGFSFFEVCFIAIFKPILSNELAIKVGMLLLWLIGLWFLQKALKAKTKNRAVVFLFTLFVSSLPMWALWSMKARGGYLTAFVCSSVVIYLLWRKKEHPFWMGGLLALTYFSQAIWFPGLFLMVFLHVYLGKKWFQSIKILMGLLTLGLPLLLLSQAQPNFWKPDLLKIPNIENTVQKIEQIPVLLSGSFHYRELIPLSVFNMTWSQILLVVFCFGIILTILGILKYRDLPKDQLATFGGILGSLAPFFMFTYLDPRYWIPLIFFLSILLFLNFKSSISYAILIALNCLAFYNLKDYNMHWEKPLLKRDLMNTIKWAEEHDVQYVFAGDPDLRWNLVYYSNEKIKSRFIFPKDRWTPHIKAVNQAFKQNENTAFIGDHRHFDILNNADTLPLDTIGSRIIWKNPDFRFLKDTLSFSFR
ncbi:MAG: hypothetical protein MRY83_18990 [Flavobacteriales bacterium]|nr:hypothetical protein [Flavobacteriales bacterium]